MTISRYKNTRILNLGKQLGSPTYLNKVRTAINNGSIRIIDTFVLKEDQRLDILAGKYYGDSRYWWIIAIASEIGYGLQVPPGTIITVPDLGDALKNI